ncbi:FtsK/SpoIIIE domain-containing protein [Lacrimispora brassicae]
MNIIYLGASFLPEYKKTFGTYLVIIAGLNLYSLVNGDNMIMSLFMTFLCSLPFFFVMGLVVKVRTYPMRKKREEYNKMFEDIGLYIKKEECPVFIGQEDTEYITALVFQTKIPVEIWENKKSLLESYLNKKIVKIKYFQENRNTVDILIENKPLPNNIPWLDEHMREKDYYVLGVDHFGYVTIDLNSTPHAFVAGETGSGKSTVMKCLIYQSIVKDYIVKLIDFKRGVSFAAFDEVVEIYSDYPKIKILLDSLVKETNDRLDMLREARVEDIKDYNQISGRYMPRIVVFIDELAELMKSSDKEANKAITNSLETLTRLSRAVGINLIMGLQRPDSTIINGQIKNNVSSRVCGRFVDPEPSRIMLGNDMATKIPQIKGRFILRDTNFREFQAFRITDELMFFINHKMYQYSSNYQKKFKAEESKQEKQKEADSRQIADSQNSALDFNFDDII